MNQTDARVLMLEQRVEGLIRLIQDLIPQLRSAQQNSRNVGANYPTNSASPGGGGGAFRCLSPPEILPGDGFGEVPIQQYLPTGGWTTIGNGIIFNGALNTSVSGGVPVFLNYVGGGSNYYVAYSQPCQG